MRFSRKKLPEPEPEQVPDTEESDAIEDKDESAPVSGKPACPNCGWHNVRPSLKRGLVDQVLSTMSFKAFRCRTCGHRFHTFRRAAGG